MDATTMRAIVAHLDQLRRDREYHRAIEHAAVDPKEESIHNRSQRHWSGDVGRDTHSPGQSGHNF